MSDFLQQILLVAIPVILAITLHEAAHGYAALALGDDTARVMGRLSLNPLRHVDRVGTIIVPGALILVQLVTVGHIGYMFGWAKPVPIDTRRFRDPRRGMMVVAAAGPAMNFVLAWLGALGLHLTEYFGAYAGIAEQVLSYFILSNLVLGLFNLIPIPPLDGGRIMVGLLPERLAVRWAKLEKLGLIIVILGGMVLPRALEEIGIAFDPLHSLLAGVLRPAINLVLRLAGVDG